MQIGLGSGAAAGNLSIAAAAGLFGTVLVTSAGTEVAVAPVVHCLVSAGSIQLNEHCLDSAGISITVNDVLTSALWRSPCDGTGK